MGCRWAALVSFQAPLQAPWPLPTGKHRIFQPSPRPASSHLIWLKQLASSTPEGSGWQIPGDTLGLRKGPGAFEIGTRHSMT